MLTFFPQNVELFHIIINIIIPHYILHYNKK